MTSSGPVIGAQTAFGRAVRRQVACSLPILTKKSEQSTSSNCPAGQSSDFASRHVCRDAEETGESYEFGRRPGNYRKPKGVNSLDSEAGWHGFGRCRCWCSRPNLRDADRTPTTSGRTYFVNQFKCVVPSVGSRGLGPRTQREALNSSGGVGTVPEGHYRFCSQIAIGRCSRDTIRA